MSIKNFFFAPLSKGLGATRRAAMLLLVMLLTMTQAAGVGRRHQLLGCHWHTTVMHDLYDCREQLNLLEQRLVCGQ